MVSTHVFGERERVERSALDAKSWLVIVTLDPTFENRVQRALGDVRHTDVRWWRDAELTDDVPRAVEEIADGGTRAVVFGPDLPRRAVLKFARALNEAHSEIGVVIVGKPSKRLLRSALHVGARDVVAPDAPVSELREALRRVHDIASRRVPAFDATISKLSSPTLVVATALASVAPPDELIEMGVAPQVVELTEVAVATPAEVSDYSGAIAEADAVREVDEVAGGRASSDERIQQLDAIDEVDEAGEVAVWSELSGDCETDRQTLGEHAPCVDGIMPGVELSVVQNRTPDGMRRPILGVVEHHIVGSLATAESRFNDPSSQASAHFGVGYDGRIVQWVSINDSAWHTRLVPESANSQWVGIENESPTSSQGDVWAALTPEQVAANGRILRWLHETEGLPLQVTDDPNVGGVAHHHLDPSWGTTRCPGEAIIAQRGLIVAAAQEVGEAASVLETTGLFEAPRGHTLNQEDAPGSTSKRVGVIA